MRMKHSRSRSCSRHRLWWEHKRRWLIRLLIMDLNWPECFNTMTSQVLLRFDFLLVCIYLCDQLSSSFRPPSYTCVFFVLFSALQARSHILRCACRGRRYPRWYCYFMLLTTLQYSFFSTFFRLMICMFYVQYYCSFNTHSASTGGLCNELCRRRLLGDASLQSAGCVGRAHTGSGAREIHSASGSSACQGTSSAAELHCTVWAFAVQYIILPR